MHREDVEQTVCYDYGKMSLLPLSGKGRKKEMLIHDCFKRVHPCAVKKNDTLSDRVIVNLIFTCEETC